MWPSEWAGQEGGAAAQLRRRPVVLFFQENAGVCMRIYAPVLHMVGFHAYEVVKSQHQVSHCVLCLCRQHVMAATLPDDACAESKLLSFCT